MSVAAFERSRTDSMIIDDQDTTFRAMDGDEEDDTVSDQLQSRLLLLEDKERSALMWRQVTAFQEKITLCLNSFDPETLLTHVRAVSSLPQQHPVLAASIHSLGRLRMVVQQQLRRASMRSDGSVYFTAKQRQAGIAARCIQYFVWFFDFMDYLAELHHNFVDRIFLPLFKFFHEISFLSRHGRNSTNVSTLSKLSQFSLDSGGGADIDDNNNGDLLEDEDGASVEIVRRRTQSKTALQALSKEFADIKTLYDTTEVDAVAQRLSFLKEQLDFILEEEDELDPELFSVDSGHLLSHLHMDEGTENLVRLPLDLLIKFRKAGWLARQWLVLYDRRTHDLQEKLNKVATLESKLTSRLRYLDADIARHERQLSRTTDDLHRLMEREQRSEGLSNSLYNSEFTIEHLSKQLAQLKAQRDVIAKRVKEVARRSQDGGARGVQEYKRLKVEFEKNKLQRYVLERQMATLGYQQQLLEKDRQLELHVRPSLIRNTNHVQDACERLEQTLRDEKRERDNIRSALLPISEDRHTLTEKLARRTASSMEHTSSKSGDTHGALSARNGAGDGGLGVGQARYVRTYNMAYRSTRPSRVETYRPSKPITVEAFAAPKPLIVGAFGAPKPGWVTPPEW